MDFCMCVPATSTDPAVGTCTTASLPYPGACCAAPAYPSMDRCFCQSFVCYANDIGGTDCFFAASWNVGNPVNPTTSATGTSCCAYGNTNTGQPPGPYYRCTCDGPTSGFCSGVIASGQGQSVPSCTMDVLPPCGGGEVTVGYAQVASCSGG
jgi:hypothetical protein